MRVGLLGATGYTGRLTAAELHRRGIDCRLGGRSKDRLVAVAQFGETCVVDTGDRDRLHGFLDGLDAVISCVGPFELLGRPVVAAAVECGVPYVDSTGEPAFIADVYSRYGTAGTPVVPACAMDYIPGDFAAALAAGSLGIPPEEFLLGYRMNATKASRGTARSAVGAIGSITMAPRRVVLPFPDGDRAGVVVPWGEELTVPRHQPQATVATALVMPALVARMAPAGRAFGPVLSLVRPLLARLVERLPEGPDETARGAATADVLAVARGGGRQATALVRCRDVYGLTAQLLVESAVRVPAARPGALAPAQAFDARAFLDAVSGDLISYSVLS